MRWLDRNNRKQPQLEGYRKTTVFKARGGAWFNIVVLVLLIAVSLYAIIAQIVEDGISLGDLWLYILLFIYIAILLFTLRYNILMLRAKIIVGPETLILDGAEKDTPKKRIKRRLIGAEASNLVVEIPWNCISLLATDFPVLVVETKDKKRYFMQLSNFDMKVTREISKYHKIKEIKL